MGIYGITLAKNLIIYNPFQVLEASFDYDMCPAGTLPPCYLDISFKLPSQFWIYYRKLLLL